MRIVMWILSIISLFYMVGCSSSFGNIGTNKVSDTPTYAYDREFSSMLAGSCLVCHGDGKNGIPKIQGVHDKNTMFTIMKSFKNSDFKSGTMVRIAKTFSIEELELLSYYFAEKE